VPEAPFPGTGSAYRREPGVLTPPEPPPPIHLERIASRSTFTGTQGQVVSRSNAPLSPVQVTLVHAARPQLQQRVVADSTGNFAITLSPGLWLFYARNAEGEDVYQGQVEVRDQQTTRIRVRVP
jgi:hypothetical protein